MDNDRGDAAGDKDGAEGASGAERLSCPPDDSRAPRLEFPVVGIGASAGGLEAYIEFLQAAPADTGMAFVLVQHLPPDRESLLASLLARQTKMPVVEVEDGQVVAPDHVYVIRPGHTLTLQDGRLRLGPELAARGHGRPIDDFFRSLAEEQQQRAVAVVFSGMGSNGSAGAEVVKAVGGLVIAQDPESARYPAMPRSVIDAHVADLILRPAEVPEALIRYAVRSHVSDERTAEESGRDEQTLGDVLTVLRVRTGNDFSGYRRPTLLRRVSRRMALCQVASMTEYTRVLRQTPAEVAALADDLLIHVTGFFRDPEAWAALRERVIDPLVAERTDGGEIRCWVAACATGEEAYTLAMLVIEAAEAHGKRFDVKVFATDMAERALGSARAGVFPNGIESEVTPARLSRFFERDESFYRVKKELREAVMFAPQNILQDPPFSRLDIATCRNLLIYLKPETQRRVLALLHFGLNEGGALLLGSSESAVPTERDFEAIDRRHRLFRRRGPSRPGALDPAALTSAVRDMRPSPLPAGGRPLTHALAQLASRALLERHTPPAVVVDGRGQVVHVHGETGRYLSLQPGGASLELPRLAREHIRGAARAALRRAIDGQAPVTCSGGAVDTGDGRRRVEVSAAPLGPVSDPYYLVTFREHPEPSFLLTGEGDATAAARLAHDLERTRNELQGALEEMKSSNEELRASHEEATSLNEELQSTNEEIETSKEEMQSLNEELITVNAQLQAKMGELEATANDLGSLLTSTDIAVLFLDLQFRIRRFTPAVRDLLDAIPTDVGRPFGDLRRKFTDPELMTDAQTVLDRLVPIERSIASESGRSYLRRILPYRTQDNHIDGVVLAFVDVSEQRRTGAALAASEAKYRALFESMDEAYAVVEVMADAAGRWSDFQYLEVNPAFVRHTGTEHPVGRTARQILGTPDPRRAELYGRVAATGESIRVEQEEPSLGHVYDLNVFRIGDAGSRRVAVLFTNITARKRIEAALKEVADRDAYLIRLSDALRPLVDPRAIEAEACRVLGERLGVDRAYYVEIDEDAGLAEVRQNYLRGDSPSLVGRHRIDDFGWVIPPMRRGELLMVADVASSPLVPPADRAVMAAVRLAAHVNAPLIKAGRLVGALCVSEPTPRAWTAAEAELVRETGERVWAAAQRARADAAVRDSEERQAFLLKLSDALRPLRDAVAIEVEATRVLSERLGVGQALYAEVEADEDQLVVRRPDAADGTASAAGPVRVSDFGASWAAGLRAGRTLATADTRDLAGAQAAALAAAGIRACIGVPVRTDGRLVGVLVVHSPAPRPWTPQEVGLVAATAERTEAAVLRASVEAALRVSEERQRLILASATDYAIFTLAEDRTVTSWSPGAAATFGYAAAEIRGRPVDVLFTAEDRAAGAPQREFDEAVRVGRAADERWHMRQDGSRVFASGVLTRLASGEFVKVTRDRTERKRMEDELREARARLEERVSRRTTELAAAVASLEAEIDRRRELTVRLSKAQEDERKRVSRDLHDTVGQTHAALTMALATASRSAAADGELARQLAFVRQLADGMGRELHDVAVRLRPTALDDLGLAAALDGLVGAWSKQQGIEVDLQAGLDERLPDEVETALFRLVQEALTNVARHAQARTVSVVVTRRTGLVMVLVEDDGVGFDPESVDGARLGLRGMDERVALLGGELIVESRRGEGTTVIARVPLRDERAA